MKNKKQLKNFAIISLLCGIVSIISVIFNNLFALIPSALGILFGIIYLLKSDKTENRDLTIAGLVMNTTVIMIIKISFIYSLVMYWIENYSAIKNSFFNFFA